MSERVPNETKVRIMREYNAVLVQAFVKRGPDMGSDYPKPVAKVRYKDNPAKQNYVSDGVESYWYHEDIYREDGSHYFTPENCRW